MSKAARMKPLHSQTRVYYHCQVEHVESRVRCMLQSNSMRLGARRGSFGAQHRPEEAQHVDEYPFLIKQLAQG